MKWKVFIKCQFQATGTKLAGVNFTNFLGAALTYAQHFCAYILGLYFTGARLLAQKLRIKRWWNWPLLAAFAPVGVRQTNLHTSQGVQSRSLAYLLLVCIGKVHNYFVGETKHHEEWPLAPKNGCQPICALHQKVGEIDPRSYLHTFFTALQCILKPC
jgi:hypothetical protein